MFENFQMNELRSKKKNKKHFFYFWGVRKSPKRIFYLSLFKRAKKKKLNMTENCNANVPCNNILGMVYVCICVPMYGCVF